MKDISMGLNPLPIIENKTVQLNDTRDAISKIDKYLEELDGATPASCHAYRSVMQAFRQSMDLPAKYDKMGTINAFCEMRYQLNVRADQIRHEIREFKEIQNSISKLERKEKLYDK